MFDPATGDIQKRVDKLEKVILAVGALQILEINGRLEQLELAQKKLESTISELHSDKSGNLWF